jgi:membrane-associated protease RseP (regulator of RpoE activity)
LIKNTADHPPTEKSRRIAKVTDQIITFTLVMYAVFAPHSIAITQGSFLVGLVAWGVQLAAARDFRQRRTPVDIALFGFFACSVVSSFLSYDPLVSIKGLKSPAFFFAFYFVLNKVRDLRLAGLLAFLLVASCLVNVAYSAGRVAVGRGVQIDSIKEGSAFARAGLRVGDCILEVDGQKVSTVEDLSRIVDSDRGRLRVKYQRSEAVWEARVSRNRIKKSGESGAARLGITTSPGRSFRVSGFYSHYETYAEVLQLIAALAAGLLIACPRKRSAAALFLGAAVLLIAATLIMTSTRAAMLGLAISVSVMAAISGRRAVAVALLAIVMIAPLALLTLKSSRGIFLFDVQEGSTAYRLEVWREAMVLIKNHPLVGIGKGSEGKLKGKLGLYDEGRLPPGHFHSTPIQIATWWGLPALAFYFSLMTILALESWRLVRRLEESTHWRARGIAIGGVGVIAAFNVSSLVHFNFGDGEVVMAFWLMTGLVFAVRRIILDSDAASKSERTPAPAVEEGLYKNLPREPEIASEPSARAAKARRN